MTGTKTEGDSEYLRRLPSRTLDERLPLTNDFLRFMESTILPKLALRGYKLDQKRRLAGRMIFGLIMNGLVGWSVRESRDTAFTGLKTRTAIWDAIVAAGLAEVRKGSVLSGKITRYRATASLLGMRNEWEWKLLLDLNLKRIIDGPAEPSPLSLIYLHSGKHCRFTGKLLPEAERRQPVSVRGAIETNAQRGQDGKASPVAVANGLAFFREIEDRIEKINRVNCSYSWQAYRIDETTGQKFVFQPNPCLRQIHVGELFRATRLYSWSELSGQSLPKSIRRTMLIDRQPVAELDYSCMATRMLYHLRGLDPKGDLYRTREVFRRSFRRLCDEEKAIAREFVKRSTNVLWNVTKRSEAHSSVGKMLAKGERSETLKRLVFEEERIDAKCVVQRLLDIHRDLERYFFKGVGIELQTTDGRIMLRILDRLADADIPALGIHDAVVSRREDVDIVWTAMSDAYFEMMNFKPEIKQAY